MAIINLNHKTLFPMKKTIAVQIIASLFTLLFIYTAFSSGLPYHSSYIYVLSTSPRDGDQAAVVASASPTAITGIRSSLALKTEITLHPALVT